MHGPVSISQDHGITIEQKRNRFCFRHRPDKRYSNKHKSNVFGTEDANMSGIYQIIAYVQNRLK